MIPNNIGKSAILKKIMLAHIKKFLGNFRINNQSYSQKNTYVHAKEMNENQPIIDEENSQLNFQKMSENFTLKKGIVTKENEIISRKIIEKNVSYITLLPKKYIINVADAVIRSISAGGEGIKSLIPDIEKIVSKASKETEGLLKESNSSEKEIAEFIAYDQTRKAYTAINKQRLMNAGIKKFEWIHSYGGMHSRASHIKIDGEIFSFENLEAEQAALGVPPEDRGLPGFPQHCKCSMAPVINFKK